MKRRIIGLLMAGMVVASTGCSSQAQATSANTVSVVESEVSESAIVTVEETGESETETLETEILMETATETGFVTYDEPWSFQGVEPSTIPLNEFVPCEGEYTLTNNDVAVCNDEGMIVATALKGTTLTIADGNEIWFRFYNEGKVNLENDYFFVKIAALEMAIDADVVVVRKDANSDLLASAENQDTKPVKETTTEKSNTEVPVSNESVISESQQAVETVPVEVVPESEPVVVESDKYTPEEAIAVYRSIIEANGIEFDPSIKEFASWGTGWIDLTKGKAEWAGNSSVESFAMGSNGKPWTKYYLEVTGSDENYVYYTGWHCN